jgi:hypothetical protein
LLNPIPNFGHYGLCFLYIDMSAWDKRKTSGGTPRKRCGELIELWRRLRHSRRELGDLQIAPSQQSMLSPLFASAVQTTGELGRHGGDTSASADVSGVCGCYGTTHVCSQICKSKHNVESSCEQLIYHHCWQSALSSEWHITDKLVNFL